MRLASKGQSLAAGLTEDLGSTGKSDGMTAKTKPYVTVVCLMLFLAACGGGGGGSSGSGVDPRLARLDLYESQNLRVLGDPGAGVMGMPTTATDSIPTGGRMTFAGSGSIRVETPVRPLVLFGDAQLRVDFDGGNAAGEIVNAFGTNASGAVVDYSGTILLESNAIGQDMPLVYAGSLSTADQTLSFAGMMNGMLLGNPTTAFAAADLEAEVDQNGVMRSATVIVVLEETQTP